MNDLGDAHLRTLTLRFMALLAADTQDQLAWLGGREQDTRSVVEEAALLCRISEGLGERGVLQPEDLRDLQAIGHRLGEIDAVGRSGLWADDLPVDPAWDAVRAPARRFLVRTLGDWRQPLPRPASPAAGGR
ncbi:hypothetical protein B046DRAFT_01546 [Streptomyces sp. LamerLS-316]|uniref:hypothetical protein n=1 Tax=unclassified Streptomyces TaxID=2593676 RepID=UPI000823A054|nr:MULTISPECIES: hypothetical protein [unclassified Streptomyces]MYQ40507.1 hypothetical protein [Streptomyces sp. SID4921]SCK15943.1 hypothetical protein B046DRAFT_01546 [Streptomyces sp. LamerLS-316]